MLQQITIQNFNEMLNRFTTAELENLLARSPYFQQAHLLLAKKYQLEHNPKFDEQLQIAALYTNDRHLFYTIFNQAVAPVQTTAPIVEANTIAEQVEELQVLQQETIEPVAEPEPLIEVVAESEEVAAIDNVVIEEDLDEPTDVERAEVQTEEPVSFASPHTFDEWLSVFKKNKPVAKAKENDTVEEKKPEVKVEEETPAEAMDEELDKMINASVSADYLQQLVQDEKHYSRGLDAFIADQIQRKRHTDVRKPAPENEIAPDLVTETLAKLYESQKRYAKAIIAYEALSLKFPEKNGLFAARINYLKKLV